MRNLVTRRAAALPWPVCQLIWLLVVLPSPGRAQDAPPPFASLGIPDASVDTTAGPRTPVPVLMLGGVIGGGLGLVAGAYSGAALEGIGECNDWCGFGGAILGGIVGESLGVALGVHLFNGARGQVVASALASLGIAAAGLLLYSQVGDGGVGSHLVWIVPVAQIGTSIHIERNTVRPRRME